MTIIDEAKKHEYWNHFISRWATEGIGGGFGPTGRKVTGPRLRKAKELIWDDETFWGDIILRHNALGNSPEHLRKFQPDTYEHCLGNFWGMLNQTMVERGIL